MMTAMPCILHDQHAQYQLTIMFRMFQRKVPIRCRHVLHNIHPPLMNSCDDHYGNHRLRFVILKFCPFCLVIRFDRRIIFCQRPLKPDVCIHMTVGKVMHHLPNGPSVRAIRSIQLFIIQSFHCFYKLKRQVSYSDYGFTNFICSSSKSLKTSSGSTIH